MTLEVIPSLDKIYKESNKSNLTSLYGIVLILEKIMLCVPPSFSGTNMNKWVTFCHITSFGYESLSSHAIINLIPVSISVIKCSECTISPHGMISLYKFELKREENAFSLARFLENHG